MLSELLNKLSGREAAERAGLEDRYARLLLDGDHGPNAVEELRSVMAALGKSAADAAADAVVLTTATQLQKTIRNGSGMLVAVTDAAKNRDAHAAESRRVIDELNETADRMQREVRKLNDVRSQAMAADRSLQQLVTQNPSLLRTLENPRFED